MKFWAIATEDMQTLEEISQQNLQSLLDNSESVEAAIK
jgi:hypothetical protein